MRVNTHPRSQAFMAKLIRVRAELWERGCINTRKYLATHAFAADSSINEQKASITLDDPCYALFYKDITVKNPHHLLKLLTHAANYLTISLFSTESHAEEAQKY